jgi:hypothetical protein
MNAIRKGYEEIHWCLKYNSLKLKSEIKQRNLQKEIDKYIQELADARVEEKTAKTREKLANQRIKELKAIIKDQKEEEKNVNGSN